MTEIWIARGMCSGGYLYYAEGTTELEAKQNLIKKLQNTFDDLGRPMADFLRTLYAWKKGAEPKGIIAGRFSGRTDRRELCGNWDLH